MAAFLEWQSCFYARVFVSLRLKLAPCYRLNSIDRLIKEREPDYFTLSVFFFS